MEVDKQKIRINNSKIITKVDNLRIKIKINNLKISIEADIKVEANTSVKADLNS